MIVTKQAGKLDGIGQGEAVYCISTPATDRDGDHVLLTRSSFDEWEAAGAPICLAHDVSGTAIATGLDTEGRLAVWTKAGKWYCRVRFDLSDPKSKAAWQAARTNRLGGASVSFIPLDSRPNGQGADHLENSILEISLTPVPANASATLVEVKSAKGRVNKYIRRQGSQWQVLSEDGKVLGTHLTRAEAERQLAAIEASKHREGKNLDMEAGDQPWRGQENRAMSEASGQSGGYATRPDDGCKCLFCKSAGNGCPCSSICPCNTRLKAAGRSSISSMLIQRTANAIMNLPMALTSDDRQMLSGAFHRLSCNRDLPTLAELRAEIARCKGRCFDRRTHETLGIALAKILEWEEQMYPATEEILDRYGPQDEAETTDELLARYRRTFLEAPDFGRQDSTHGHSSGDHEPAQRTESYSVRGN